MRSMDLIAESPCTSPMAPEPPGAGQGVPFRGAQREVWAGEQHAGACSAQVRAEGELTHRVGSEEMNKGRRRLVTAGSE